MSKTMRAIRLDEYGPAENLKVQEVPLPDDPGPDEVWVKVEACGINYRDILARINKYPISPQPPFIPGVELVGRVMKVGSEVSRWKEGDRLIGGSSTEAGGYAEYAKFPAFSSVPLPEEISASEGLYCATCTQSAYHILITTGRLQEGESFLIHAAAGGLGTSALQIAKLLGAGPIFGTASHPDKLALVKELGADHVINYQEESFRQVVKEKTADRGLDLIIDSVGGKVFQNSTKCLAPFGRLVVAGLSPESQDFVPTARLLFGSVTVAGFHLDKVLQDEALTMKGWNQTLEWAKEQKIRPIIAGEFPLEKAAEAHQLIESRKNIGKVILTVAN